MIDWVEIVGRATRIALTLVAFAASSSGQATISFDCYPDGLLPLNPASSCEGVVSNGLGGVLIPTGVTSIPSCGFPTAGTKYLRLSANGPVSVGAWGPFVWPVPLSPAAAEVRVPIPPGATTVSFDWEYFNAESFGSIFNDGMAVGVVSAAGMLVQQLVYADNQLPLGTCTEFASFAPEVLPSGPQAFSGPLPALAGCEYLSVVCWNGGDNSVPGIGFVDNVAFDAPGPSCVVPCFPGSPALGFSSPGGAGCLAASIGGAPASGTYFLATTMAPGAFPNGWFLGIDIGFQELITEVNLGYPFSGPTNVCGEAQIGPFCGLPSNLQIFAVALGIVGQGLGPWTTASQPTYYLVP